MRRVNFSDWQEMALKKDIEDIKKRLNSQEPIFFSMCWEIVIALGSIIADHLFDVENAPTWVWIIVILGAVVPPIIIIGYQIRLWIHSIRLVKKGKLKTRAYVNLFDNQISYWVMLSNSYADLLTEATTDGHSSNAEKEFLYREGCYYNNKSMQALYSMKPNFYKIFSKELSDIKQKNLIDLDRLHNLLDVMHEQQRQLDRDIMGAQSRGVRLQQDINRKYIEELQDLLADMNAHFPNDIYVWEE